jgi:hypothetical protein
MSEELVQDIEIFEDNFGYGNHRAWARSEREAWHVWVSREGDPFPIEECDCNDLP